MLYVKFVGMPRHVVNKVIMELGVNCRKCLGMLPEVLIIYN
jgi:hypothetical protein